jgi:hypothetical protein
MTRPEKIVIAIGVIMYSLFVFVLIAGCQKRGTIVVKHDNELIKTDSGCSCEQCECRKVDLSALQEIADALEADLGIYKAKCVEYRIWAEQIVEYCRSRGITFEGDAAVDSSQSVGEPTQATPKRRGLFRK